MSNRKTGIVRRRRVVRLAARQGNACFHCGGPLVLLDPDRCYDVGEANGEDVASIDHVVPADIGGTNHLSNLVVAHRGCNSKRGSRPPTDDELARLAALNEARADLVANGAGGISPDTFGRGSAAAAHLADILNRAEGPDGRRLREKVNRRLAQFTEDIGAVFSLPQRGLRDRLARMLYEEQRGRAGDIENPAGTLMLNVMKTAWRQRREAAERKASGPPLSLPEGAGAALHVGEGTATQGPRPPCRKPETPCATPSSAVSATSCHSTRTPRARWSSPSAASGRPRPSSPTGATRRASTMRPSTTTPCSGPSSASPGQSAPASPAPADAPATSSRKRREHEAEHAKRVARLAQGVYGEVGKAVLTPHAMFLDEPPTYLASRNTVRQAPFEQEDGVDRRLDYRCFFTGVRCAPGQGMAGDTDRDVRKQPWLWTRDHLVPRRRDVPGTPVDPTRHPPTLVWASNVANVTLGLAPLMVRLKVREWIKTAAFDRGDTSVAAGQNVRWLIVGYLDGFRWKGRLPWSRDGNGQWWDPGFSGPFMHRMFEAELRFLSLPEEGRNRFVEEFSWHW